MFPEVEASVIPSSVDSESYRLVGSIRSGNERALETLYYRYRHRVFSLAVQLVNSSAEAEEISQDVFVELWKNPPHLPNGVRSLEAWLCTTTKTRSWKRLRYARRRPVFEPLSDDTLEMCLGRSGDYVHTWSHWLSPVAVNHALDRAILRLTYVEGMSSNEIAETLAIPPSTVRKHHSTLLRKLRQYVSRLDSQASKNSFTRNQIS
jgi:RNA polymerase sigma-70 factor (ECF subfamily)